MPTDSDPKGAGRRSRSRRPLAVDLFAGAGGLSLGLEQAGFDVVAAVEYDPVHAAAHEFNFPQAKVLCADISELSAEALKTAAREGAASHGLDAEAWDGEIDLIAGGPPCQGFSFIGKRLVDDKRNRLVFHFFRLVSELRPRYFVMENVPGMARGGHASILDELIAEFEEAGYRFPDDEEEKHRILNAADFGVPQERNRLFLIGTREDQANTASPPQPTVRHVPKRSTATEAEADSELPAGPTVWDAIGDLPNLNRYASLFASDTTRLSESAVEAMESAASAYARRLRGLDADPTDLSHRREWDPGRLTSSMRTEHTEKSIRRFKATKPGETEPVSRYYRLDPDGLCNTLRAGSGSERGAFTSPRPLHPRLPRVLSNREAARLHSFPDWFRLHTTKWHGFRQIGNAVAPLVGRAVGHEVVVALDLEPSVPSKSLALGEPRLVRLSMSEAMAHFGADRASIPAPRTRGASPTAPAEPGARELVAA
jgi:DNA (cytosine-5)-methyltransferase 1